MIKHRRLLRLGNNIDILKTLDENSIDSVVTDPPYGLKFMNKKWDHDVPSVEFWKEVFRVLKPGGHVLSFGGTRTYHRMVVNIEDSGFEIRDQIMWLYGSGFPKSHNISKGIDKKLGINIENTFIESSCTHLNENSGVRYGKCSVCGKSKFSGNPCVCPKIKPSSDLAKQWSGFGTALKPANEPIVLARKPLSEKTIVDNVLKWGTGGLNVDGCRVEGQFESGWSKSGSKDSENLSMSGKNYAREPKPDNPQGRWPANVILDEVAGEMLDEQSGLKCGALAPVKKGSKKTIFDAKGFTNGMGDDGASFRNDKGGASRFFYCAKASKKERNAGLENSTNGHPTIKPIKLMEYLIKLITPPDGVVLDPFMGSGSTGVAAKKLGFDFVGMELDEDYFKIAKTRINKTKKKTINVKPKRGIK